MWLFGEIALVLMIPWIFWPVLVLASAWLIWCVIDDASTRPSTTIWPLVAIGILLYLAGWYPSLSWQQWTLAAAVYLPIGSGYSIFRWKMFVRDRVRETLDLMAQWRDAFNQAATKDPGKYASFEQWMEREHYKSFNPPAASANKGRIYIWILYWPISFVSYVMRDMVTHLLREIYARLSRIYDRITASEWTAVETEAKR